ncbi:hypothetical protein ACVDFE_29815 [Lentzea chajnantorensis]
MTDPVNPEAPHSPGTPDLDDLDTPEPDVTRGGADTEPEVPQENPDAPEPPD